VLSTEVMQLRERCQKEREEGSVLQSRVGHLQVCHSSPVRRSGIGNDWNSESRALSTVGS
jgi:hypothetical protein